jgi:hypothetical protein
MASGPVGQGLASFNIWGASGVEIIYESDIERDRLREEDEEQEDPGLLLSVGQHSEINLQLLKRSLPTEAELQALKCASTIRRPLNGDNKPSVVRLTDAAINASKFMPMSALEAYGTPPDVGSPACFLIVKPSASKMKSGCLDPSTHRPDRVGALDMAGLAQALGVQNWEEKTGFVEKALELHHGGLSDADVENPWSLRLVAKLFCNFVNAGDTADEPMVEGGFTALLMIIGKVLGIDARGSRRRKFAVGGMLALPNFCVQGITDATYVLQGRRAMHSRSGAEEECMFLTAEFKTDASFPPQNLWYRGTRGVQTLAALWSGYELNKRASTLLVSQSRYKLLLLVRDVATNALHMYQYPGGYRSGNTRSKEFLKMIGLVLLSAHEFSEALLSSPQRLLLTSADTMPDEPPTIPRALGMAGGSSGMVSVAERPMVVKGSENDGRCAEMDRSLIPFKELSLNIDARRRLQERMRTAGNERTAGFGQELFNWENRVWTANPAEVEEFCDEEYRK